MTSSGTQTASRRPRLRGLWTAAFVLATALLLPCRVAVAQDFGEYRIGPKDLIEIKVFEAPELNGDRRVSDAGTISLPMIGEVKVEGMSSGELRDRLTSLLTTKYVNRANVSVVLKEYGSKPITVIGAVSRPGTLNISGRYFLLQAISAAGGLNSGSSKKIYILRTSENGLTDTLEVRTADLFESSNPMWNIPIAPSDVINVPGGSTIKIFCLGELKAPGQITFDSGDRITLLSAIAKAGGLTDRASKTIRIKRRGDDGKDVEFTVDYKKVLSGAVDDPELKSDDVLIVKESFF